MAVLQRPVNPSLADAMSRTLSPHPLSLALIRSLAPERSVGMGLLSVIIVTGLGAIIMGAAATAYLQSSQTASVSQATVSVRDLNQRILTSYASAPDFSSLTTQTALNENLFPKSVMRTGTPLNAWNGPITVTALNVAGLQGPGNNNGFVLTYENVAAPACPRFVLNASSGFQDVKVNGVSAMAGRQASPVAAGLLCSRSPGASLVQFIQTKASPEGINNPELTPCVIAPGQSQAVACPPGQISSVSPYSVNGITQTRYAFCNSAYGQMGWSPWVNAASTCAPICTPPASIQDTATQTAGCDPGRVTPAGASSFTQAHARTVSYACPAPTGPYATLYGPYGPWSPLESAACAPKCVAPAATTQTQTITASCPGGQLTSSGSSTFSQSQSRPVTYACPAPTGSYTTAYGGWSAGNPAASAVCSPMCVPLDTTIVANYRWVGVDAGCPAGYSGSHTYQAQQSQLVTTVYSCLSLLGTSVGVAVTTPWANTGAIQADNNACVAPPAPPACVPYGQAGGPVITSQLMCIIQPSSFSSVSPTYTPPYPQSDAYGPKVTCQASGGTLYANSNTNPLGGLLTSAWYRVSVAFGGNNYTAVYSCSALNQLGGQTCTPQLVSGSMPPGTTFGGLFLARPGGSQHQFGAGLSPNSCP